MHDHPDTTVTLMAGLSFTAINRQFLDEIANLTARLHVIPQTGSTFGDGPL